MEIVGDECSCVVLVQGSAAVGIKSATSVVMVALKRSTSELSAHQKKMYHIDDHVGVAIAGLTSDARMLRWASILVSDKQELLGLTYRQCLKFIGSFSKLTILYGIIIEFPWWNRRSGVLIGQRIVCVLVSWVWHLHRGI